MMVNKARAFETKTILTGDLTYQVYSNGPTEVEISGTFGSVVLGSSTEPTLAEKTISADERFKSEMSDMLFTLTGTGPVVVRVTKMPTTTYLAGE